MCGICGIYNYKNKAFVDKGLIEAMMQTLTHRGPDAQGAYVDRETGLGHRRLSIIDLSTGNQPMPNEDNSVWIVFNGEIYNYPELRERLKAKGHRFHTKSDTEVIIHLYEEMQEDCVTKLNGIFSFCIWDAARKKVILARDRLGIKPLFYAFTEDGVTFASEVKALIKHPLVSKEIDIQAIDDFFSLGYITAGKSIFSAIKSLPPATILSITSDNTHQKRYWDIQYKQEEPKSEEYYIERLRTQLAKTVKMQMTSDVPVGAFLSGGLDSSCIVSFMIKATEKKVRTFSIGFLEKSYDELNYARLAARLFKTQHKDMQVSPDIQGILPRLAWFYDEPFLDTSNIPTYFLAKLAASELKVVLSGDGGDENFSGYPTYVADKLAGYYKASPGFLKKVLNFSVDRMPVSFNKVSLDYKAKRFIKGADAPFLRAHYSWRMIFDDEEKENFYSGDFKKRLSGYSPYHFFEEAYNRPENVSVTQRLSYVDFKTWLADDILRKVDRASMANSLEARVPLLDHELVELAAGIPDGLKLRRFQTKYIFKKAMLNHLPKRIIYRRKKGFNSPVSSWIKNELRPYVLDYLSPQRIKKFGYFEAAYVENMLKEHFNRTKDNGLKIWGLLNFILWHEIFIEGKPV